MTPELKREFKRKAFHCLSLVYLGVFFALGRRDASLALGAWIAIEGIAEAIRLRNPELNARLMGIFGGIHREKEMHRISGILWTSLGCLGTIAFFGSDPRVVAAGIGYLAFGDGVAALAGRAWGRRKWPFLDGKKSVEGSLACLTACFAVGVAAGLPPAAVVGGAIAATVLELLPLPLDDNLWLPLLSAGAVSLLSAL
jgi:dolichol kinase